jgi:hypothetical protein
VNALFFSVFTRTTGYNLRKNERPAVIPEGLSDFIFPAPCTHRVTAAAIAVAPDTVQVVQRDLLPRSCSSLVGDSGSYPDKIIPRILGMQASVNFLFYGPTLPVHISRTGLFSVATRGNSGIVYDRRAISRGNTNF